MILRLLIILLIPHLACADGINIDFGEGGALSSRVIQILALMTILSLAPSILVMVTSFTRIVVVLSFLRTSLGLQQTPPNSVLISLALFLTAFIMAPSFDKAYQDGIEPLISERINEQQAWPKIVNPFRDFMLANVRDKDLHLFSEIAKVAEGTQAEDLSLSVVVPAFMISELRRAFEIGFLIFVPFLIIDMLVASVLMAMGMMMLPPVTISLPFKIIFFVLIDGWYMITGSLVRSFGM